MSCLPRYAEKCVGINLVVFTVYSKLNQTITGFFESGFKLTVNTDDSVDNSTFRYNVTSL